MERTQGMTAASAPVTDTSGGYIDWAAVLAGAAIAAAIGALSTTFGAAVGLSVVSLDGDGGSGTLALVLGAVWTVISLVASYAAGGYVAGRMRRRIDHASADEVTVRDGMNGLTVWAVGMLVGLMLLANAAGNVASATASAAGSVVSGAGAALGGAAEGGVSAMGSAAEEFDASAATSSLADGLLRTPPTPGADSAPAETTRQVGSILAAAATTGEISAEDRAYLESAVAARTGAAPAEVTAQVDEALAAAETARTEAAAAIEAAKNQAIEAAEKARISAVLTAFLLTAASLVAGAAATGAAVRGGLHRDEGRAYGGLTFRR